MAVPLPGARAQVVSCSMFLHNHDGSWSSFVTGEFLGRYGPVPLHAGQRFSHAGPHADIARLLDRICLDD